MEKKVCPRCHKRKSLIDFHRSITKKDGRMYQCKVCQLKYLRGHYLRNKDYYKAKARRSNSKRAAELLAVVLPMKSQPCTDCGKTHPHYVMDFDHARDRKSFNISNAVRGLIWTSAARLLQELRKCDLVCANCHRSRTWLRQHPQKAPPGPPLPL